MGDRFTRCNNWGEVMNVLLTFTGFHDPYFVGLVDPDEQPGPILSLLSTRPFDHVFLFDTPSTSKITQATKDAISGLHQRTAVHILSINLDDPTTYQDILKGLRAHLRDIIDSLPSARFFIAVASGTPQMHACWLLLTASGEVPAHILHVRPPKFVTKDFPLVSEIDLSFQEFPAVRFHPASLPR